jgi:hypothetical protein
LHALTETLALGLLLLLLLATGDAASLVVTALLFKAQASQLINRDLDWGTLVGDWALGGRRGSGNGTAGDGFVGFSNALLDMLLLLLLSLLLSATTSLLVFVGVAAFLGAAGGVTVVLGAVVVVVDDLDLDTALRLESSLIDDDGLSVVGVPRRVDHICVSNGRSRGSLGAGPLLRGSTRSRRAVDQDNALLVVSRSSTLAVQV